MFDKVTRVVKLENIIYQRMLKVYFCNEYDKFRN